MDNDQAATQPKTSKKWPKWLAAILLVLTLLVSALVLSLPYSLPAILASQQIELQFTRPSWQFNGFNAEQISLSYQENQLQIDDLKLRWNWFAPELERLEIGKLTTQLQLPDNSTADVAQDSQQPSSGAFELPSTLPNWLPQQLLVHQLDIQILDYGQLQGELSLDLGTLRQPDQLQAFNLQFELLDLNSQWQQQLGKLTPQQLFIKVFLPQPNKKQSNGLQLQLAWRSELNLDLSAELALQMQPQMLALINDASLQVKLEKWQLDELQAKDSSFNINNANFVIDLKNLANSSLQLPLHGNIKALQHPQLYPQDWQLNGEVSGNLQQLNVDMQLTGNKGIDLTTLATWQNDQLDGSVKLSSTNLKNNNPLASSLRFWPSNYQLKEGQYSASADFHYANQLASGRFDISTQNLYASLQEQQINNLTLRLGAEAKLNLTNPEHAWRLDFENTGISFVLDSYQLDKNTKLEGITGAMIVQGSVEPEQLDIKLSHPAVLRSNKNRIYQDLGSQSISAELEQLSLRGNHQKPEQLQVAMQLNANIEQLKSLQLKSQAWSMHGQLSGALSSWRSHIQLNSQHGFRLDNYLNGNSDSLSLRSQLAQIDFSFDNPIERTLQAWPELLSLDSGTIDNQLSLEYTQNKPIKVRFSSSTKDINGIYNSSALSAVNLELQANIDGEDLAADIGKLSVHAINPGIPLKAISISGANYRANINNPLDGNLAWNSIYAQLLNGNIYSAQHSIWLDRDSPVLIEIDNLELQELMRVYPTEGLQGDGSIDGQIPLIVSNSSIRIDNGRLAAKQPGRISFKSPELAQMANSNPGLKILNQALDDFHFKVLTSDLSFEKNGKLVLAVRLEGNNPDFEKGRPIHFNFNLEQNLFALLDSIQLTNHINDLILQRLHQRSLLR